MNKFKRLSAVLTATLFLGCMLPEAQAAEAGKEIFTGEAVLLEENVVDDIEPGTLCGENAFTTEDVGYTQRTQITDEVDETVGDLESRSSSVPNGLIIENNVLKGFSGETLPDVLSVPEGVTEIAENAFIRCNGFTELRLPTSLQMIGRSAFYRCSTLERIIWQGDELTVGYCAFDSCSNLQSVSLNGKKEVHCVADAFEYCGKLSQLSITADTITIEAYAFCKADSLRELRLSCSYGEIRPDAFNGCSSLEIADIPGIYEISGSAFTDCSSLRTVNAPDVGELWKGAFKGCPNIQEMTCSFNVSVLWTDTSGRIVGVGAPPISLLGEVFPDCESLPKFKFANIPEVNSVQLSETASRALYKQYIGDLCSDPAQPFKLDISVGSDGCLTAKGRQELIDLINYFRQSSNVAPVTMNSQYNQYAQAGCEYLAATDNFSHSAADGSGNTAAATGLHGSNLAGGYGPQNIASLVLGLFWDDDSSMNALMVGHRRWLMNSRQQEMGVGYTPWNSSAKKCSYLTTYSLDTSTLTAKTQTLEVFPGNGAFPVEAMAPIWSVSIPQLNNQLNQTTESEITLTIIREDGKRYSIPYGAPAEDELFVTDWFYIQKGMMQAGSGPSIIFSPASIFEGASRGNWDAIVGHTYTVRIEGIRGPAGTTVAPIEYSVKPYKLAQSKPTTSPSTKPTTSASAIPSTSPTVGPTTSSSAMPTTLPSAKPTTSSGIVNLGLSPEDLFAVTKNGDGTCSIIGFKNSSYATQVTDLVIPSEISGIKVRDVRFSLGRSSNLKTVRFDEGIEEITGQPFIYCQNLRSVHLPDSLTKVSNIFYFMGCTSLEDCNWPAGLTVIPGSIFSGCTALNSFTIPEWVTEIGGGAFRNTNLREITLPVSLRRIGPNAFTGCTNLKTVQVQCGQLSETDRPFSSAEIDTVVVEGGVHEVPAGLFYSGKVRHVVLKEGVECVGDSAFANSKVESIQFPKTLHTIGESAFTVPYVQNLYLPDSIRVLGQYAFAWPDGNGPKAISIPNTLESIGYGALCGIPEKPGIVFRGTLAQLRSVNGNEDFNRYKYVTCDDAVLMYGNPEKVDTSAPSSSPSASAKPTTGTSASPEPSAAVSATTMPSSPTQPGISTVPTAKPAPGLQTVKGYQAGYANSRPYYAKNNAASTKYYLRSTSGKMTRVAAPGVKAGGQSYYPAAVGSSVLFPRVENGKVTCYSEFRDGMEIPRLAVQAEVSPAITGGYQTGTVNGRTYYVKVSGASMKYYLKSSSGKMTRVAAPGVTGTDKTRYYPINYGGTVLFPKLTDGRLTAYTTGSGETVLAVL